MQTACGATDRLQLKSDIFLSHSGADKDFMRFVDEALRSRNYHVFYDERSLPKAKRISMRNILAELKHAKLAVVLLSEQFFKRTPHPMSELATIVAENIQMLPIFYDFNVDEFKVKCRNQAWLDQWKMWVNQKKISKGTLREWEKALEVVSGTNGLEYCKEATNTLELRDKVLIRVYQTLKPNILWSKKGLQGMDRLCEIVSKRFADIAESIQQKNDCMGLESAALEQAVIVGIHGLAGIGKSTLSQALCDFFFQSFNSRVCYIELGDHSEVAVRSRLELVLSWLTSSTTASQSQALSVQQLWNLLKERIQHPGSQPVFLAIDNVKCGDSMYEVEKYLECGPFPKGSRIFLTAQSAHDLALLTRNYESCSWVQTFPFLDFTEAKKILLQKIGTTSLTQQQDYVVDRCVRMCTLNKRRSDFYPLLLVYLAFYMGKNPLKWQERLHELQRDGLENKDIMERVEIFIKKLYDSLRDDEKHMLIDLALFLPDTLNRYRMATEAKHWLAHTYNDRDVDSILSKLEDLSLVESRDRSKILSEKCFHVHDLLRDFVKKEAPKSSCIYKKNETVTPWWRPPKKSRRMGISCCEFTGPVDFSGIKKIDALHLSHNKGLECVQLNETVWMSLQSLIAQTDTHMNILLPVKADMKDSQHFYWELSNCGLISEGRDPSCFDRNFTICGRYLAYLNLQNVQMSEQLGVLNLGEAPQLRVLNLDNLPGWKTNLQFERCPNIKEIWLKGLCNLKAVSGLENSFKVSSLYIKGCDGLRSLVLLDTRAAYRVYGCSRLESIEVRHCQLENIDSSVPMGSLFTMDCPLVQILGLLGSQFISTVEFCHDPLI